MLVPGWPAAKLAEPTPALLWAQQVLATPSDTARDGAGS